MAVNSPTHTRPKQTKQFWFFLVGAGGLAVFNLVRQAPSLADGSGFIILATVVAGILILVPAVFWIVFSIIRARVQNAKREFPGALIIPVTFGNDLVSVAAALASSMGRPAVKVRPGSSGIVAINSNGVHISGNGRGPWLEFPAAQVSLDGFTSTMLGVRTVEAFVIRVESSGETFDLPLVAIRMRGNVARVFRAHEVDEIVADVATALRGYSHDGWSR